jgi:hypothetical protein
VIETTIHTVTYGDVTAYGRVSSEEAQGQSVQGVRHNPVARNQPVEMAMKRSLARAERFAFGTESLVDDDELEDAARTVIEERNDPEVLERNSRRYAEIFKDEEDDMSAAVEPNPAAPEIVDKARAAARQREMDLAEVDRQRREEGLIQK